MRDIDVKVIVDDAMQDLPDMAMLGGRPRIGVSTRDVSAEEAKAAGLTGITGAYVSDVPPDSAAGKAGLQAKDIIVTVDGETIRSARQLARVISESPEGRALQIGYVRGTAKNTVSVTPEARSLDAASLARASGRRMAEAVVRRFERARAHAAGRTRGEFDLVVPPGAGTAATVSSSTGRARAATCGSGLAADGSAWWRSLSPISSPPTSASRTACS